MSQAGLSREDLRAAVAAGVVTEAQAARLSALATERAVGAAALGPSEERFELFRGLNDVFVAVGVVLLLIGAAGIGRTLAGPGGAGAALAVLSWSLAELLVRRRRMVLPGLALSAGLAVGLLALVSGQNAPPIDPLQVDLRLVAGFGAAATGSALFHLRFGLPFALFAAAIAAFLATLLSQVSPDLLFAAVLDAPVMINAGLIFDGDEAARDAAVGSAASMLRWVTLAFGLFGLAAAIAFDLRDPHRLGRASANAFWLHAAAGPALAFCTAGAFVPMGGPVDAAGLAAAVAVLVTTALVVDRRSLLLSATAYVLISIANVGDALDGTPEGMFTARIVVLALVAVLGAGVVGLGVVERRVGGGEGGPPAPSDDDGSSGRAVEATLAADGLSPAPAPNGSGAPARPPRADPSGAGAARASGGEVGVAEGH